MNFDESSAEALGELTILGRLIFYPVFFVAFGFIAAVLYVVERPLFMKHLRKTKGGEL